ncbi:hypothetical protein GOP47_0012201 [Adiantum capillus-veneris]|uniref:Uncharacterized protein n=1 Tax=Adiantum capillus-veneris TaxID=13818 RepID=A0A9D4UQK1_ADICA|nr:hypothetical protein GOP47_0012201 [Adiantum capillus-veneris]
MKLVFVPQALRFLGLLGPSLACTCLKLIVSSQPVPREREAPGRWPKVAGQASRGISAVCGVWELLPYVKAPTDPHGYLSLSLLVPTSRVTSPSLSALLSIVTPLLSPLLCPVTRLLCPTSTLPCLRPALHYDALLAYRASALPCLHPLPAAHLHWHLHRASPTPNAEGGRRWTRVTFVLSVMAQGALKVAEMEEERICIKPLGPASRSRLWLFVFLYNDVTLLLMTLMWELALALLFPWIRTVVHRASHLSLPMTCAPTMPFCIGPCAVGCSS